MRLHQAASFSAPLMRIPAAGAIFWPGCALLGLDAAILRRTEAVLRRGEPGIALAACCCGQPTRYLFPERLDRRQEMLLTLLKKRGVERIYTACPNCTLQLRELKGPEIIPVWPALATHIRPEDLSPVPGPYIWHDPCPTRADATQQQAVRALLDRCGCAWEEPPHSGAATLCCGNRHMLHTTNPDASRALRRRRLAEFPEGLTAASSCEGCLGAFRSEGRAARHLLEILFGESTRRGWGNRLTTTFSIK